jgi:predicted outer membrane protein
MSASLKLKFGVLGAGLSCLLAGYVVAQQQEQATGRTGQLDRPATQPAQPGQRAQTGQRAQPGQREYTAEFRGTQTTGAVSPEIERYLLNCLLIKNQAEVEISEFAQQQAQNPEVKQFAQMLIRDHQQAVQKLQQLAGPQGADRTSQTPGARSQFDTQQTTATTERPGQSPNQRAIQTQNQSLTAERQGGQSGALNELIALDRQITDRATEMVREELQAKSGPDFDQCFVAAQIGSHTHMLAALEVIDQKAQGQLKQVIQEAQPKVQQHLDHAKQLAEQLKSGAQTGARAQRQPAGTQR